MLAYSKNMFYTYSTLTFPYILPHSGYLCIKNSYPQSEHTLTIITEQKFILDP